MKPRLGRVGLCVLQSAGGTGSCLPDETAQSRAVQKPHPAAAYLDSGPSRPLSSVRLTRMGCPIQRRFFYEAVPHPLFPRLLA